MRSSSTASSTSAVSRSGSTATPSIATPSRGSCSRMKRPNCSSPTRVISADFRPSRAAPMAMLAGQPPTDLAKERDVLQPRADLLAVEVDRGAPDGDDIERLCACGMARSSGMSRRRSPLRGRGVDRNSVMRYETEIPLTVNVEYSFCLRFDSIRQEKASRNDFVSGCSARAASARSTAGPSPHPPRARLAGDRRSVARRRRGAVGGDRRAGARAEEIIADRRSTRC